MVKFPVITLLLSDIYCKSEKIVHTAAKNRMKVELYGDNFFAPFIASINEGIDHDHIDLVTKLGYNM